MREICTLRSMSGKRKRSAGFDTKPKSPRLFSTLPSRVWNTTTELSSRDVRVGAGFSDAAPGTRRQGPRHGVRETCTKPVSARAPSRDRTIARKVCPEPDSSLATSIPSVPVAPVIRIMIDFLLATRAANDENMLPRKGCCSLCVPVSSFGNVQTSCRCGDGVGDSAGRPRDPGRALRLALAGVLAVVGILLARAGFRAFGRANTSHWIGSCYERHLQLHAKPDVSRFWNCPGLC